MNKPKPLLSNRELLCLFVFFIGTWIFLFVFSGGPQDWDEYQYIDLSMHPREAGHVLNRYMHIYLQKVFLDLAGDPLLGVKAYWGFAAAITSAMVYLIGRSLTSRSSPLHGMAAVLIFFTSWSLWRVAGSTYADITVMMLVSAGVLFFLFSGQSSLRSAVPGCIALGVTIFLVFKSKETGVVLAMVPLGYLITGGTLKMKDSLFRWAWVLVGVSLGLLFLFALDFVYLGDAFYSLRQDSVARVTEFTFGTDNLVEAASKKLDFSGNRLGYIVFTIAPLWLQRLSQTLLLPSLLFLVSLITDIRSRGFLTRERVVWLLPIGTLVMLILIPTSAKDRHFFLMHPFLAACAVQFLPTASVKWLRQFRLRTKGIAWLKEPRFWFFVAFFVLFLVYSFGPSLKSIWWGYFVPISSVVLLFIAGLVKVWNYRTFWLTVVTLLVYTFYGIVWQFIVPLSNGSIASISAQRYGFLEEIADTFTCDAELIYVSLIPNTKYEVLNRDASSAPWFFNVVFNCDFTAENFVVGKEVSDEVTDTQFDYMVLDSQEYADLPLAFRNLLETSYNVRPLYENRILFLSAKDG